MLTTAEGGKALRLVSVVNVLIRDSRGRTLVERQQVGGRWRGVCGR